MTAIPAEVAAELTRLRAENARLLRLLKLTPQQAAPPGPAQAAYSEAPPGPSARRVAAGRESSVLRRAVRCPRRRVRGPIRQPAYRQTWMASRYPGYLTFSRCPDIADTAPGRPRIAGVAVRSLSCGSAWSA